MKKLFLITALLFSISSFAQQNAAFWSNSGNNVATNDFLGSVNNTALVFKANNQTWMRILPTGVIQINSIANLGTGLVTFDNNGNIVALPYINDNTKVLYSDGTWGTINFSNSGWTNGYDIVYNGTGNVGIGTFTPQYKLDVWGNLRVTGTVFASGVVITDEVNADTGRIPVLVGNTSLTGDVGIGGGVVPNIKLNVVGDVRTSGKLEVYRITALPGDSLIRFGDSTIYMSTYYNSIFGLASSNSPFKGLGLGQITRAKGLHSTAIGFDVGTDPLATNAIVIGAGLQNNFIVNSIANSLMVGFNSNVPTLFVSSSNGNPGSTGNVGIATTAPQGKFQINNDLTKIIISDYYSGTPYYFSSFIGFNAGRLINQWVTNNDSYNNGGTVLISGVDGSFRFVTLPSTYNGQDQTFTDAQVFQNTSIKINNNGNVEIGVITNPDPAFKLSVNGKIRAKELKVYPTWSDFVFHPDYYLMPLDSVEKFVTAFGHLPNVPNAKDVETNGIDVGKSNAILLMKTEELFLYTFKLNKKVDALANDNKDLKLQNNLLTKQNTLLEQKNNLLEKEVELLKQQLAQQQTNGK